MTIELEQLRLRCIDREIQRHRNLVKSTIYMIASSVIAIAAIWSLIK